MYRDLWNGDINPELACLSYGVSFSPDNSEHADGTCMESQWENRVQEVMVQAEAEVSAAEHRPKLPRGSQTSAT